MHCRYGPIPPPIPLSLADCVSDVAVNDVAWLEAGRVHFPHHFHSGLDVPRQQLGVEERGSLAARLQHRLPSPPLRRLPAERQGEPRVVAQGARDYDIREPCGMHQPASDTLREVFAGQRDHGNARPQDVSARCVGVEERRVEEEVRLPLGKQLGVFGELIMENKARGVDAGSARLRRPHKCQKRPTMRAKETYYRGKRDLLHADF